MHRVQRESAAARQRREQPPCRPRRMVRPAPDGAARAGCEGARPAPDVRVRAARAGCEGARPAPDVRVRGPRLLNVINGACVIRNPPWCLNSLLGRELVRHYMKLHHDTD